VIGLIIGKFMPLHMGHIGLIEFAAARCDQIIVHLAVKPDEPISGALRLRWLEETFTGRGNIRIKKQDNYLPDSAHSSRDVSKVWADYLKKLYPEADCIFSSETYGDYLGEYMCIASCVYDQGRNTARVSATDIRHEPLKHWDHIPPAVRPYYVKKACVYGPESTGKSTLTEQLAAHFRTDHVPEIAREVLGERPVGELVYKDIDQIATTHAGEIIRKEKTANRVLFCDTDIITTMIYSGHYLKTVPPFDQWIHDANRFDLYLFCDIDVPWVADPQRDAGHLREMFRRRFMDELDRRNIPFELIRGNWNERFESAKKIIAKKFNLHYE